MTFTLRRILRWDDPGLRDLNVMFDELSREIAPEQGSIASTNDGVAKTDVFVSEFYPGIQVSGTAGVPTKIAHGLGVTPRWVGITLIGSGTNLVFLERKPDDKYIYLAVTSGARKVWIKAEV